MRVIGAESAFRDRRGLWRWILVGVMTGFLATAAVLALRPVVAVMVVAGLLMFLPTLFMKEPKRYFVAAFILSLLLDISKRLTKDFVHPLTLLSRYGLPPSGNLSIDVYPSDVILFGLVVFWLLRILTHKEAFYLPRASYLPLIYFGWVILSSLIKSPSLLLSVFELVRQGVYFVTYLYIANNINTRRLIRSVMFACLGGLFLEAVVVIVTFNLGSYPYLFGGVYRPQERQITSVEDEYHSETKPGEKMVVRSRGTFNHPGGAALYFEFLLPLALISFLSAREWKTRLFYFFLFMLGGVALLLTFSRAAFLGAAVGVSMSGWLARRRNLISKRQFNFILGAVAICVLLLAPKIFRFLTARPQSFTYRFVLIEKGFKMLGENPILGVGLNNSSAANSEFWLGQKTEGGVSLAVIHNQYLLTAIETGLVGFALYMGFFALVGLKAYRCSRSGELELRVFSIAIWGTYLSVAVHVTGDPFATNILSSMLWMYAGLIMSFEKMRAESTVENGSADGAGARVAWAERG